MSASGAVAVGALPHTNGANSPHHLKQRGNGSPGNSISAGAGAGMGTGTPPLVNGNGYTNGNTSPISGIPTRSPRMGAQRLPALTPLPPGAVLAQQLSVHLATATRPPTKRSLSRSAPTSPMARPRGELSPLSTISPIDIGASSPTTAAVNEGVANGSPVHGINGMNGYADSQKDTVTKADTLGLVVPRLSPSSQPTNLSLPLPPQAPVLPVVPQIISAEAQHQQQQRAAQLRLSPELQMRSLRYSPEVVLKPLSPMPAPNSLPMPASSLVGVPAAQAQRSYPPGTPQRGATVPGPQGLPLQPSRGSLHRRNRSRSRSRVSSSGSEDTETEVDSDSTFVPGRIRGHQHSRSQPDLSALRSRLVEGWADGVRREQLEERRLAATTIATNNITRRRSHGRKTPPMRPLPLGGLTSTLGASSSTSFSSSALHGSHGSRHSPRQSTTSIPVLTPIRSPITDSSSSEGSFSPFSVRSPVGGMTGSEDADDDDETDSLSSGSLTFSPKHRNNRHVVRQRSLPGDKLGQRGTLGLSLEPTVSNSADEASRRSVDIKAASIEARLQRSSLLSFRLLAIVPALWGSTVLTHALFSGALWYDVWPWGVDFGREALERLVAGDTVDEGILLPIHRGDMVLAIAWACLTAHFCYGLTTGLTHRWRNYYSLPSTVTRLVSLQCLCWPATYITLQVLGAHRPLLAWVTIGVTTGCSRTVQMWVTSNVVVDSSDPGDVTPSPFSRLSPPPDRSTPKHVRGWRVFTHNRRWSWDLVGRKVGWKVGAMLLVTCAWLFWRLENLPRAV